MMIKSAPRRSAGIIGLTLLASIVFVAFASVAQAQTGGAIACPPRVDLSYSGIQRLPYAGKAYDIAGLQPNFAPIGARLIAAELAPLADASNELQAPKASTESSPGEITFKLWDEGKPVPKAPLAVTCRYEGGYALQRALAATTQRCVLRYQRSRPPASETTMRELYTSAVFTCS